jgi:subtilisin family serine protease
MGTSFIVDDVLRNLIASGVSVAVAAGNGWGNGGAAADACMFPFSNVAPAIVVAASDATDTRTRWTNYGACVDLFAPGLSITSAISSDDDATAVSSGTSMAAPHAAGAVALILEQAPGATPAEVQNLLKESATQGIIQPHSLNSGDTPENDLLFSRIVAPASMTGKPGGGRPCTPKRQREGTC